MSADNGLIVRLDDERYKVIEYDASSGHEWQLTTFRTLEQAVKYAQTFQTENVVEYGISFDLESA